MNVNSDGYVSDWDNEKIELNMWKNNDNISENLEWIALNFRPWVLDQSWNGVQNKHQSQSWGTWKKLSS